MNNNNKKECLNQLKAFFNHNEIYKQQIKN